MSRAIQQVAMLVGALALSFPVSGRAQTSAGCTIASVSEPPREILRCPNGLTVEAEQGAHFDLLQKTRNSSPNAVSVSSRAVLVDVPPGRRGGFQVLTPHAIASVRGTTYAVDAQPKQTSVFVVQGVVAVAARRGRQAPVQLMAGQGVDVQPGQPLEVKTWGRQRAAALLARFGR
jgi:hypothetical protein